jgi:uncharacterized membrane protein YczE
MGLDPTTLAVGAAIGGGVGTLATLVIIGLIARYVFRMWQDFDNLRTKAMDELRTENADLRAQLKLRGN